MTNGEVRRVRKKAREDFTARAEATQGLLSLANVSQDKEVGPVSVHTDLTSDVITEMQADFTEA